MIGGPALLLVPPYRMNGGPALSLVPPYIWRRFTMWAALAGDVVSAFPDETAVSASGYTVRG